MADDEREWLGGYGEVSAGEPPRHMGSGPGFGSRGMGYGVGGGSWGVYGLPSGVVNEYAESARGRGGFDEPHGRVGYGYSGSFGTAGEHSARQELVRPKNRGPKFTRSDSRIREDICERLSDDDAIDASEVTVEVKDGLVTLTGTVQHRAMKHRIEDLAAETRGVKDVENRLTLDRR